MLICVDLKKIVLVEAPAAEMHAIATTQLCLRVHLIHLFSVFLCFALKFDAGEILYETRIKWREG